MTTHYEHCRGVYHSPLCGGVITTPDHRLSITWEFVNCAQCKALRVLWLLSEMPHRSTERRPRII